MNDYKSRVIQEKADLDIKLLALKKFVETNPTFYSLSSDEQMDLKEQLEMMAAYSNVLQRRLVRWMV